MNKKVPELTYTDDNISLFIRRFTTGHWAMQGEVNLDKGSTQYIPPSERCHLTPKLVKRHLDTEITLASYTITPVNTCRFVVIDFDIDSIVAKMAVTNPGNAAAKKQRSEAMDQIKKEVSETLSKMADTLRINRNQILVERSGVKGYHLWMFFEEDVPALDAYRMGRVLSDELELAGYEIYPMQPSGDDTKPGSLIKLPLGINRKNFERCFFLDDTFEPIVDSQWRALEDVVPISTLQLGNLLKLKNTEVDRVEDDSVDDISQLGGSIDLMISKCVALQAIADKTINANPDDGIISLSHDERLCILSIFKKFGVVGISRIHEFLQNTDNYDVDKTNKIIESSDIKPMRCSTMMERCICHRECENIQACGGKSPIKLSIVAGKRRGGKGSNYVLNSLSEIENPVICNKSIRVDFTVCSLIDSPYYSPRKIVFSPCDEMSCPNYKNRCGCDLRDSDKPIPISESDKLHIQVYGMDDKRAMGFIRGRVEGCSKPEKLIIDGAIEQNIVQPFTCSNIVYSIGEKAFKDSVDNVETDPESAKMAAKEVKDYMTFFMGSSLETSKTYRGYGTVLPNPHNQSITILFNKVEPLNSQIDGFKIDESNSALFEQFKSMPMEDKIKDIRDNIAFIYGRDEVILAILMAHFSALEFSFNNTPVSKGWGEVLLIGDSGQAKSLLTERILKYIGLGKIGSSNSSFAGLIGGVEKVQNKSYINWGLLPRCNKGLIFLDEVQNLNWEIVSNLRTVRQHGYADVNKIVKGKHEAKVRLICAANPPKEKTLSQYKYGAMSLEIMLPPDLRRFDMVCFLSEADNDKSYVNKINEVTTPMLSSEAWRTGALWMWSRKPEEIVFTPEVTKKILESAVYISNKFDVASYPICNASDMREKIARLVVGYAGARCATPDNIRLIPEIRDVETVVAIMDSNYSHKSVGLDRMAAERKKETDIDPLQYRELKEYVNQDGYSKMRKVISGLIDMKEIRVADLGGWAQASPEEMSKIVAVLNKYQMIGMGQFGSYSAKPKLMKFLNMLIEEEREYDDGPASLF